MSWNLLALSTSAEAQAHVEVLACTHNHGHSKSLLRMSLSGKETVNMVFPGEGRRYVCHSLEGVRECGVLWRG